MKATRVSAHEDAPTFSSSLVHCVSLSINPGVVCFHKLNVNMGYRLTSDETRLSSKFLHFCSCLAAKEQRFKLI